ncbi:capsular polysaccharide synthesis protein [Albibacterium indicum]|uniref:capsular polysaccharide synthesis protein n=1 Tax=Albibacterium indicum TaxID=2292082 RepID=UPI000E4DFC13|nr:capsular polysaccharide synthesis protein [Pedobacter indicus]
MKNSSKALLDVPAVQFYWRRVREQKILRDHKRVANYWNNVITDYIDLKIERHSILPKYEIKPNSVIWQYWGQGLEEENLPEVVKICFSSVDKFNGDYEVIRLTDNSIRDYLDIPDFVWEKRNNPEFKTVFFSDLLRLALLHTYGGVWLDATVLLTDTFPKEYSELDYFVYQRDDMATLKEHWVNSYAYYWNWRPEFKVKMLSSFMFAKKDNKVIRVLLNLILHYWKTENKIIDYFFFQILYEELMNSELASYKCPVVDDTLPHMLQTKINGGLNDIAFKAILEKQGIHKLTYFSEDGLDSLRKVVKTYL